jgi:hypothetical protein
MSAGMGVEDEGSIRGGRQAGSVHGWRQDLPQPALRHHTCTFSSSVTPSRASANASSALLFILSTSRARLAPRSTSCNRTDTGTAHRGTPTHTESERDCSTGVWVGCGAMVRGQGDRGQQSASTSAGEWEYEQNGRGGMQQRRVMAHKPIAVVLGTRHHRHTTRCWKRGGTAPQCVWVSHAAPCHTATSRIAGACHATVTAVTKITVGVAQWCGQRVGCSGMRWDACTVMCDEGIPAATVQELHTTAEARHQHRQHNHTAVHSAVQQGRQGRQRRRQQQAATCNCRSLHGPQSAAAAQQGDGPQRRPPAAVLMRWRCESGEGRARLAAATLGHKIRQRAGGPPHAAG